MSVVAAVTRSIEWGSDHHWRLELPEIEQRAAYWGEALSGGTEWRDAHLMECAEKYVDQRRIYQNMPVFDI